jgi:hypothetical protein
VDKIRDFVIEVGLALEVGLDEIERDNTRSFEKEVVQP